MSEAPGRAIRASYFPVFAKGLAAIVALTLVLPASAASYAAGEERRTTSTSSAAVRNHGNGTLRITIWYPAAGTEREVDIGPASDPIFIAGRVAARAPFADAARHPLILASHGFGGTARQLTWLGAPLARHGFIVAAVDHPGTNGIDGVTPEGAYAPWERAGDLKAALDFLLADPMLASHIDARRIGVAGFSLGGFTGALEAGARTNFDQFIRFCNGPSRDAICNPQLEFPLDYHQQAEVLVRSGDARPEGARAQRFPRSTYQGRVSDRTRAHPGARFREHERLTFPSRSCWARPIRSLLLEPMANFWRVSFLAPD